MKQFKHEAGLSLNNNKMVIASSHCIDNLANASVLPEFFRKLKHPIEHVLPIYSILVTTNWNKNDDIFSPDETWKARYSPIWKPANLNHNGTEFNDENQIIGVINSAWAVDIEYQPIMTSSEEKEEEIPNKYHILTCSYLWHKYFPTAINELKKCIEQNEMYVSMECIFGDFGYGLRKDEDDDVRLIPRNEFTAFLTKYLRAYGGTGEVEVNGQKYKIGRWLRNFDFSGVGFVKRPGNPESIIFSNDASNPEFKYSLVSEEDVKNISFDILSKNCVLSCNQGMVSLWPTN